MTELLPSFVAGRWVAGTGTGTPLLDPVLGHELARVDATGLDLPAAFRHARQRGGAGLRELGYRQRGELLAAVAKVLQSRRDEYFAIATANSGTVKSDSAVDIDGAIYTISTYAKLAAALPDGPFLPDGEPQPLARDGSFATRHVQLPTPGLALLINAFNFPAWGLWEKAAPALLSGVPVLVKPATATAWLTQRMVRDVVEAGVLPAGALSIVCGGSGGLLDALEPMDVISFTGSAESAASIRAHPAIARHSVRSNIEADSLNSAWLLPGEDAASPAFGALVKEVVRELTVKSGQKCTAIRRIFVPESLYDDAAGAIAARLGSVTVGNPRNEAVRMGSLVSRNQLDAVREGLAVLRAHTELLHDGAAHEWLDADPAVACIAGPTLLGARDADAAGAVHDTEVFGPVATLLPYRDAAHAKALIARGGGSLVCSVYGSDARALAAAALALGTGHGRVHLVSPDCAESHTGHGNVMPQSLHGGPGRAGGGEELGGLRALGFFHHRVAIQGPPAVLTAAIAATG